MEIHYSSSLLLMVHTALYVALPPALQEALLCAVRVTATHYLFKINWIPWLMQKFGHQKEKKSFVLELAQRLLTPRQVQVPPLNLTFMPWAAGLFSLNSTFNKSRPLFFKHKVKKCIFKLSLCCPLMGKRSETTDKDWRLKSVKKTYHNTFEFVL